MKKIRMNYLNLLNFNKKNKFHDFIKNETLIDEYTEGLSYSELNYLTFDEIEYLFNNLDKTYEMYNDICEMYEQSKNILNKFFKCVETSNFEELSTFEENRVLILQGYKTYLDVFPDFFKKVDDEFVFSNEELEIKTKFEDHVILKTINSKNRNLAINCYKYNYIYYSMQLYLMCKENNNIDEELIKNKEREVLLNTFEIEKSIERPTKNGINTLRVFYINEKNPMNKFSYYHLIVESSRQQDLVNRLAKQSELDKLNLMALIHMYLVGGGNTFALNKKIKVSTLNNNKIDEIYKLLKDKFPEITALSNIYKADSDNSCDNNEKDDSGKIINFPKRK